MENFFQEGDGGRSGEAGISDKTGGLQPGRPQLTAAAAAAKFKAGRRVSAGRFPAAHSRRRRLRRRKKRRAAAKQSPAPTESATATRGAGTAAAAAAVRASAPFSPRVMTTRRAPAARIWAKADSGF